MPSTLASPVERALAPDVDVGDGEDRYEDQEPRHAEPPEPLEHDGERTVADERELPVAASLQCQLRAPFRQM